VQAILVFSFIKYHPVEYGKEQYPLWADLVGWMMPLSTNLPILIVAVLVVYNSRGNTILEVTAFQICGMVLIMVALCKGRPLYFCPMVSFFYLLYRQHCAQRKPAGI